MTDTVGIAAAIITARHRVLMVRRRVAEGDLSWQFPAGKIEDGESPEQAAVRETAEETGLAVMATASLGTRVHPNTGRTMHYIACRPTTDTITARVADVDELDAVEWATAPRLAELVPAGIYEPVRRYLDDALNA